jgi:hypothetical protein
MKKSKKMSYKELYIKLESRKKKFRELNQIIEAKLKKKF